MKLTQAQKNEIYCVKYGHSKIVNTCFGYIHCQRCDNQIGDTLGSVFDLDNYVVIGHVGKEINGCHCTENYRNLPSKDKKHIKPAVIRKLDMDLRKATPNQSSGDE